MIAEDPTIHSYCIEFQGSIWIDADSPFEARQRFFDTIEKMPRNEYWYNDWIKINNIKEQGEV